MPKRKPRIVDTEPDMPSESSAGSTAVLDLTEASGPPFVEIAGLHIEAEGGGNLIVSPSHDPEPMQGEPPTDKAEMMVFGPMPLYQPTADELACMAEQHVVYLHDDNGRVRGADVWMFKSGLTYRAAIRWRDGQFYWLEPDASCVWQAVKRGQHQTSLQPIVEQAIEYAIGRVFGTWIT